MKKVLGLVLIFAMIFSMVACGNSSDNGDSADSVTIKVAHWFAEDHPQHQSFLKFKEIVEAESGGTITVEIYPNSQLGSEDTYIDSVKQGTVQIGATGTMIAKYAEHIYAAETPFLVADWEEAQDIYTGDAIQLLVGEEFESASGMQVKAVTVNGFREFSSN